jgi:hypothetical protein
MGVVCSRLESAANGLGLSYLAGRDELQRAQRALQVGNIVLEVSQRLRNVSSAMTRGLVRGRLALAMLVSISEGFCLEGLLGAILFSELDMLAADVEVSAGRRGDISAVDFKLNIEVGAVHTLSEALASRSCTVEGRTKTVGTRFLDLLIQVASNCVYMF